MTGGSRDEEIEEGASALGRCIECGGTLSHLSYEGLCQKFCVTGSNKISHLR
jgi:hypothetical protein